MKLWPKGKISYDGTWYSFTSYAQCNCENENQVVPALDNKGNIYCKRCGNYIRYAVLPDDLTKIGFEIVMTRKRSTLKPIADHIKYTSISKNTLDADERIKSLEDRNKGLENRLSDALLDLEDSDKEISKLKIKLNRLENGSDEVESQPDLESDKIIAELESKIENLEKVIKEKEVLRDKATKELSEERAAHGETRDQLATEKRELASALESVNDLQRDIEIIRNENVADKKNLSDQVDNLGSELDSTRQELGRVRYELENSRKTDVKRLAELFLTYVTAVYNKAQDAQDLDELKTMAIARTEQFLLNAESCGITISSEERGECVKGGMAKMSYKPTDDPALDGKVVKMKQIGCSFKDDTIGDILEQVVVWKYTPPTPEPVPEPEPATPVKPGTNPEEETDEPENKRATLEEPPVPEPVPAPVAEVVPVTEAAIKESAAETSDAAPEEQPVPMTEGQPDTSESVPVPVTECKVENPSVPESAVQSVDEPVAPVVSTDISTEDPVPAVEAEEEIPSPSSEKDGEHDTEPAAVQPKLDEFVQNPPKEPEPAAATESPAPACENEVAKATTIPDTPAQEKPATDHVPAEPPVKEPENKESPVPATE